MKDFEEFRKHGYQMIDTIIDYYKNIESYPVKSQAKPRDVYDKLPDEPPQRSEKMEKIMADFQEIVMPGITHWQSPNFFAYFPANSSFPSLLAEMLTSALGAQCMKWETSPAAAELEEQVMDWLRQMLGLPGDFYGVIHDTASTATLTAILTAREKYSGYRINENGFESEIMRVYCSEEAHSSVEKAVKIAGIGRNNLVKIGVDNQFRLIPQLLEKSIIEDIEQGKKPICVVAAIGTTSSTAIDPLYEIAQICNKYDIWLHVDAAYAGSALILPEYRHLIKGIELTDSFVFNPHKWLFTNFDCSAFFLKDKSALIKTFIISPEYLKTSTDGFVNNYCDWGIQLGRRFRALKLWFVIRSFGVEGLKDKLREHIRLASIFAQNVRDNEQFELLLEPTVNLVCFRFVPGNDINLLQLNDFNYRLLTSLNNSGSIYLSHTILGDKFCLRFVTGQTNISIQHVEKAWNLIIESASRLQII